MSETLAQYAEMWTTEVERWIVLVADDTDPLQVPLFFDTSTAGLLVIDGEDEAVIRGIAAELIRAGARTVPASAARAPEFWQPYSEAAEQRREREFLDLLGPEAGPEPCRQEGCSRLRIAHSVYCRRHHYESTSGKAFPEVQ